MRIAEHLYLNGYITYPRTESTSYSSNFDFNEVLVAHKDHPDWGDYVTDLIEDGHEKPRPGNDKGDHPPITPVKCASQKVLFDLEWKLYQFITQNFFATISRPAKFKVLRVMFQVGPEHFELMGKQLVSPGFLEITPWLAKTIDVDLPNFRRGEEYDISHIKVEEGKTHSPGYLTESDLISCMEANEIGTDASIPTHIKNIIDRGYVKVNTKKGRQLIPTNLGMALARGYCAVDPELILPKCRSYIEKSCDKVAKGEVNFEKVVDHVLKIFKKKFEFFQEKFSILDNVVKTEFVEKFSEELKKEQSKEKRGMHYDEVQLNPEDLKSYEHCTVFEDYKSVIVEKNAHIRCAFCTKGELKKIKTKNKTDTTIHLLCTQCRYEITGFKD
jgi:DNA topoisomerase-3